jgi:hypothetical protein
LVFSVGATQVNVAAPLLEPPVPVEVTVTVVVGVDVAVSVTVGVAEVVAAGVLALSSESEQPATMAERANKAASAGNFTNGAILSMRFPH